MPVEMDRVIARPVGGNVAWLPEEENEKDVFVVALETANNMDEATTRQSSTRRKSRASFSGFSHAMSDLCALPRKIASQRRKPPATPGNTTYTDLNSFQQEMPSADETTIEEPCAWDHGKHQHPHINAPGWLRRCVSTTFRHRRQTFDAPSRPATAKWTPKAPVVGLGVAPRILPEHGTCGAAARAAAAAQNEVLDVLRRIKKERLERKVPGDAESGVDVDTRPGETETTMARQDPSCQLPKELFTQILSYLDARSLIHSELVSRQWYACASDRLVWKQAFNSDFRPQPQTAPENSSDFQVGGRGFGNEQAGQDWKRTWKVRKALHQRWTDTHAAAIYLEGHYDSVYCVQFDENKILTGSRDRTIRIWDARSVLCLQYDDELMITGSSDCCCIVWDIRADWTPIRRVRYHNAGVLDVCFDRKHVVSCSKDTTVCLWDRLTGELIHRLTGHRGPVNAVQLRGNLAVSASGDGVAKLWNLVSGNCIKEFPSKDRGMACVEFSPDSRTIFAGGNDRVIYQFDASSGELLREFNGHNGLVRSLHLDSANGRVVSGSYDTSVRAYDIRTGNPIVELTGWTTSWILSAKLDYRRIIATSQDSRVVVIDFGYNLPGIELLERQHSSKPRAQQVCAHDESHKPH